MHIGDSLVKIAVDEVDWVEDQTTTALANKAFGIYQHAKKRRRLLLHPLEFVP